MVSALLGAAAGFYLAASLPLLLTAGLLFLTPMSFLVSTVRNSRTLVERLALGFGLPLAWLVTGDSRWQSALAVAACCMIGLLVERWLFFAEARHTVRLYHGDPRT